MSEKAKNDGVQKTSWFRRLKSEFKKVIWPTKEQIAKNTVVVVVVSVALGLIIAGLDSLVKIGVNFLTQL